MKRLTIKHIDGRVSQPSTTDISVLIYRLAAYEDTGLEPEEIKTMIDASMEKAIAEIKEFEGIPIDRLRELAEADKEGRCVVLPCKVFQYDSERIYELEVRNIIYDCGYIAFDKNAIDKSVFLTREAAEAALKEREQNE